MSTLNTPVYQVKSPVLFVIFNRPDTTERVFEQIRAAKPKRLYIAADAPRAGYPNDILLCERAKEIIKVDWDCELKTLFREENAGLKEGVSSAVTWFFDQEDEGIILEDDCLPANSFFKFCDTLLKKYRHDTRIRHITGCNLQQGKKWGDCSYYFSHRSHVWGWASWKRAWKDYDKNLDKYDNNAIEEHLSNIYENPLVVESWANIFKGVKAGEINSWAYPLDFTNFFNNGLTIIPNENLISNIGFDERATHTIDPGSVYANVPLSEVKKITHPTYILPERQADLFILNRDFNLDERIRKENSFRSRFKRWSKSLARQAAALMLLS